MEELNICLINDSFPPAIDGVANAVTNYAGIINDKLGKASVVTPFYPDADDARFGYPILRYPSIDMTKAVGYRAGLPFSAEILEKIEKSNFDLIHSHCPITSTMLARLVRSRIDKPIVFTYHTKFDIDIANAIRSRLLQEEAARALVENINACDEVWTVSRGAGENLRALGYEGEYIVMPNGVDLPRGRVSDALICEVGAAYDLPEGVPVFLYVGRMMWYKGIRITLDALKLLDAQGIDFRMVFVGGGNDKEEIMAYCETLGLGAKVFFSEPIRDRERIRAWYCRADLFLFPSTFDTNGLVVREAAACELGSILVKGSCAAEDSTDGVNSFFMEENAESMAAVLTALCAHPEEMKRVGQNAQRDLYMSWEESVCRAYERYGIVIDRYRSGLTPAHARFNDEVFASAAHLLGSFSEGRERQKLQLAELRALGNTISEELEESGERILDAVDNIKDVIEERREKLHETLERISEHMDRFL